MPIADAGLDTRSMPWDEEAEKAILGTILVWPARLDDLDGLRSAHFYRAAHKHIFDAIVTLRDNQVTPDGLTVKDALLKAGKLDAVGGFGYLSSLTDGIPRSSNVAMYADIVKEKAKRRELVHLAQRMGGGALGDAEDVDALIQSIARDLFALEQDGHVGGFQPMRDVVQRVMEQVETWCSNKKHVTGVATGFTDLDDALGGLQPTDLVVLAARPSMGKSSLMMAIAEHAAMAGQTVGVFSLEMSADQIATRELSAEAEIEGFRLRRGYLRETDWGRLSAAIGRLSEAQLFIDETPNLTVFDMRARARRLKAEHGLSLLVIDYLQLMDSSGDRRTDENRVLAIGKMTRGLKQLAKELHVPIVLLSQLSRAVESRSDKRPMLSDLRESGSIEQDADVVMFIYRAHWYDKSANEHETELIIAKQRNGPTGLVKLHWVEQFARFYNAAPANATQARLDGTR